MTIAEILSHYGVTGSVTLIVFFSLVEIAPIKWNPISSFFKFLGRAMNKEMIDQLDSIKKEMQEIDKKVNKLDNRIDESSTIQARARILRFGDEVSHGTNHSRDHFQQIFADITSYNNYCHDHPDFQNDMTKITSKRIEDDYIERDKTDNFL